MSYLDLDASSDENDGDYVPTINGPSDSSDENEDFDLEINLESQTGKRNGKQSKEPETKMKVENSAPTADEKKRADNDIWLDFLSDVGTGSSNRTTKSSTHSPESCTKPNESELSKVVDEPKAEVFEFAGETFIHETKVPSTQHEIDSTKSIANEPSSAGVQTTAPKKRGGLESIMGSISNKKKKCVLSTLEKTLLDWKTFKADEGLVEDLEQHNKGKKGFIERQRFLERSDLRSFEIEKSIRQSKRKI